MKTVATAPASIGNIGVGYDVLGQAFPAAFDRVTATRTDSPGVRLGAVTGLVTTLPADPQRNSALRAAQAVLSAAGAQFGAVIDIDKGIPLSAGMGGSGASAVAGAAAANALLDAPFETEALLPFALEGERVTADPPAWDNVAPTLFGGIVIAADTEAGLVRRLPAPDGVEAVLVHPDFAIETAAARGVLSPEVPLTTAVEHARRIAAFTLGCATSDHALIRAGLEDVLIEAQRARLVPGFAAVKQAAMNAGALGCSLSGSGPSVFAWCPAGRAQAAGAAMADAFAGAGLAARIHRAGLDGPGVAVERIAG
ncbi:MAG: homoserine kinase [Oceanicaulis sp.]